MSRHFSVQFGWLLAGLSSLVLASPLAAQAPIGQAPMGQAPMGQGQPIAVGQSTGASQYNAGQYNQPQAGIIPAAQNIAPQSVPQQAVQQQAASPAGSTQLQPAAANEHPLMPTLRWAREGLAGIEKIDDYTCTLVKRERLDGVLGDYQSATLKVRHRPFSVYMKFNSPAAVKGRECIFIDGANSGKMWAHGVGMEKTMFGTVSLPPDGTFAMRGQRYPITQIGILNLTRRLIEVAEQDIKYGECEVKFFKGAKINNSICTCIQVVHPVPRKNFLFHMARIFVDDNLNMPIRYESYDWPKTPGAAPQLIEEYTYLNIKFNQGLAETDFNIHNAGYEFP